MIAKVIGALVVLGIVGYFLFSLGTRAQDATKSEAVSKLQKELQQQRAQMEGLDIVGVPPQPEPVQQRSEDAAE
ncbi:MAG: hypothetical protein ACK4PK_02200 [Alphaproteobacteria bacterium]